MTDQKMRGTLRYLLNCITFVLLFFLLCNLENLGALETEDADRIVAIVNDDIIVLSELNGLLKPYIAKIKSLGYHDEKERSMLYEMREDLLNQLVDDKLRDQEVESNEITIDEKEIDNTIERIKQNSLFTDEELRAALMQEGLTLEDYRQEVKGRLLRSKLVSREITSKIVITEEDIKAYYNRHSDKYGSKAKYHLRNIIMKPASFAGKKEKLEVKNKMEEILEKLKAGESFKDLAGRYSESSLAVQGGDLGLFEFNSLSKLIKSAIIDLKPGQFTPVLDTDQGLQIFLLEEIVKIPGTPLEEVSTEIEAALYNEIVDKNYSKWIERLRKQAHIEIIR